MSILPVTCSLLPQVFAVLLVGSAGVGVGEIGEPFELRRDLRQVLELGGSQRHWQDRSQGVRGWRGHSAWSPRADSALCIEAFGLPLAYELRKVLSQVARRGVRGWYEDSATTGSGCHVQRCPGAGLWA